MGESRTCWQRIRRCLELLLPLVGVPALSQLTLIIDFFSRWLFLYPTSLMQLWALGEHMQALLSLNLLLQAYVSVGTKSILVE